MKIGIIGSGAVATTLAAGFIKHGHDVTLGTREASKLAEFGKANPKAKIGSFADAAKFGDMVVLAVKGTVAENALALAGADHLKGKTVIDATNPIADAPPENGVLKFFTEVNQSLMEKLQGKYPAAHFVKAFNSVGAAAMVNPSFKGGKPSMFIAGNDAGAKQAVSAILDQFGWEVEDMGPAAAARAIEPLCMLWCIPGFARNDWFHAFKMLR
ncbi:MAG: NAD(P)-binding domain-containing protein [Alphaproteobacteria bacterium]|nr:NAD(P)-binding domain-containing protein [Alphaproteobacteria bacterium]